MAVVPKVVVIGAGFGGLEVARHLKGAPVEVTLVDQHNFHTFQPLLYQVATAGLNAADVAHPVRGLFHAHSNVRFRQGRVTGVDWVARTVGVADQPDLPFDHLVLAGGTTVAYFGTPGAEDHAFPLYALADATHLRNHVLRRFEAADTDAAEIERGGLTFVVVGGGPTGVETAGALAELFAMVFRRDYPSLDVRRARVVLVEMQDHLLHPFTASSRRHALETLRARGVEVRLGAQVASIAADHVTFADGEVLPCQTLVWAAGVRANPLAAVMGLPADRGGRVVVAPDLQVAEQRGAWAIGDIAATRDRHGELLPQLAPVAMQSGRHVARQIRRQLEGRPTEPFRYRDRGTMATIGRRSAVAELPAGIRLWGAPAWIAWLGLHLVFLVGKRNRLSVLLNWAWNYLTWDRGPRLILDRDGWRTQKPARQPLGMIADAIAIRAAVEAYCTAFSTGDQAAYVALFATDAWIEDPVGTPRADGHEGIAAFFAQSSSLADSIELRQTGPVRVAAGECAFPMQARPVIGGATYAVDIIDVMTFDDAGKITTMRAFWDPAEMRPADDA